MVSILPLRRRRPDSFEQRVGQHLQHLYRLAYRFSGSREDAEDLVQDLLLRLYPRQRELAEVEQLRPWLARALYRLFIDRLRREKRSPIDTVESLDSQYPATDPTPEDAAMQRGEHRRVELALYQLNDDQRLLVTLHDIEGYTLGELEGMLDTPIGTLKSRLHRARRILRETLREPFEPAQRVSQ